MTWPATGVPYYALGTVAVVVVVVVVVVSNSGY
jgi:hypothetical protein